MNQGDTKGKSILDRGNIKLSLEGGARRSEWLYGDGQREGEGDEAGSARARYKGPAHQDDPIRCL